MGFFDIFKKGKQQPQQQQKNTSQKATNQTVNQWDKDEILQTKSDWEQNIGKTFLIDVYGEDEVFYKLTKVAVIDETTFVVMKPITGEDEEYFTYMYHDEFDCFVSSIDGHVLDHFIGLGSLNNAGIISKIKNA